MKLRGTLCLLAAALFAMGCGKIVFKEDNSKTVQEQEKDETAFGDEQEETVSIQLPRDGFKLVDDEDSDDSTSSGKGSSDASTEDDEESEDEEREESSKKSDDDAEEKEEDDERDESPKKSDDDAEEEDDVSDKKIAKDCAVQLTKGKKWDKEEMEDGWYIAFKLYSRAGKNIRRMWVPRGCYQVNANLKDLRSKLKYKLSVAVHKIEDGKRTASFVGKTKFRPGKEPVEIDLKGSKKVTEQAVILNFPEEVEEIMPPKLPMPKLPCDDGEDEECLEKMSEGANAVEEMIRDFKGLDKIVERKPIKRFFCRAVQRRVKSFERKVDRSANSCATDADCKEVIFPAFAEGDNGRQQFCPKSRPVNAKKYDNDFEEYAEKLNQRAIRACGQIPLCDVVFQGVACDTDTKTCKFRNEIGND